MLTAAVGTSLGNFPPKILIPGQVKSPVGNTCGIPNLEKSGDPM